MQPPETDISAPVEYTIDRSVMHRNPVALLGVAIGVVVLLNTDARGRNAALMAVVYIALLGLAFAGWYATKVLDNSRSFFVAQIAGIGILAAVVLIIGLVTGSVGRSIPRDTMLWSGLVSPPPRVFGWMLVYLGGGYIAYAVWRHLRPGRPIIRLTSRGLSFHRPWLADVEIPWQSMLAVGPLELAEAGQPSRPEPRVIAVTVPRTFFETAIAPKRRAFAPPGTEVMFRPRGDTVQFVLSSLDIVVQPDELRVPLEQRWNAFHDVAVSVPVTGGDSPDPVVCGRWHWTGSWWEIARYSTPVLIVLAGLLNAAGLIRV